MRPLSVSLGYLELALVFNSELLSGDKDGEFQPDKDRIVISERLTGKRLVDTVIHEIKHAMWHLGEIKESDAGEEFTISTISHLETELWLRNPQLLKWISRTLRK